jgi:hypothetical protein
MRLVPCASCPPPLLMHGVHDAPLETGGDNAGGKAPVKHVGSARIWMPVLSTETGIPSIPSASVGSFFESYGFIHVHIVMIMMKIDSSD